MENVKIKILKVKNSSGHKFLGLKGVHKPKYYFELKHNNESIIDDTEEGVLKHYNRLLKFNLI